MTEPGRSARALRGVLVAGLVLRVLVAWLLAPENNDRHLDLSSARGACPSLTS